MKIAYLIGLFPAISETFILNQIIGMIDLGHDVQIFSLNRPKETINHPDVEKYELLKKTIYLPKCSNNRWMRRIQGALLIPWFCMCNPRLLKYFNTLDQVKGFLDIPICAMARYYRDQKSYDVTHAQFGHLGVRLARLKMANVICGPLVTSFRGGDTTILLPKNPNYYDRLFECGDLFMAVSNFIRHRLINYGCPKERVIIHHSGIDLESMSYRKNGSAVDRPVRLLCIARLVEVKGVEYLIEAVNKLLQEKYDIILDILGDGPLMSIYHEKIKSLGIEHQIVLHGYCDKQKVLRYLYNAHMLVAPSIIGSDNAEEGMPNSIKEAIATGIPVIATNTGGIPELIVDGVTGFLVPQKDAKALAEKIVYLVDNYDLGLKLAKVARGKIEKEFDLSKLNSQLVGAYINLIANSRLTSVKSSHKTNSFSEEI